MSLQTKQQQPNIKESTLVIPSISIGNVPQLAVDLLIHTFKLQKIGTLEDKYLFPFASPIDTTDAVTQKGVSCGLEVFYDATKHITIIQQRSPIISGFTKAFVDESILPFISEYKFAKILVLDSADAGQQEDQIAGSVNLLTKEDLLDRQFLTLLLEQQLPFLGSSGHCDPSFTNRLLNSLHHNADLFSNADICVLLSLAYEGDNFGDGERLASKVVEVLKLGIVDHWARPRSWLGVYGNLAVPSAMEEGVFA